MEKYLFKELNSTKRDTGFSHFESQQLTNYFLNSKKTYIENYINSLRFQSGNAAPKFKDFENITGGKNSLIDFKGNYILLNIWATWCKPCIDDIVLLNQLSNHYQILKIINISIDNFKDKSLWNKIVDDKKFKGIHLFAGSDNNYLKSLNVVSVPRFVLIDPNGKMITDNIVRNFQNFKTYLDPMLK